MLSLMQLPRELQWLIVAEAANGRDGACRLRATNKHLSHVFQMRAWTSGLYLRHKVLLMHFTTLEHFRSDYFDGDTLRSLNKKLVDMDTRLCANMLQRAYREAVFQGKAFLETEDVALPVAVERGQRRLSDELRAHEKSVW